MKKVSLPKIKICEIRVSALESKADKKTESTSRIQERNAKTAERLAAITINLRT